MTNINNENPVSRKMQELSKIGSEIRNTFMLGQKLFTNQKNLIDLSLGNPDLDPPVIVRDTIQKLMNSSYEEGGHRYMDSAGLIDVREFLAKELSISEGVEITPKNVYLTVGAAGALQICMRAFLDVEDEVIIFTPYFPEYLAYSHHLQAIPIIVDSDENHIPIFEQLAQKITAKTKLVIVNSPNNPSGVYYSLEHLNKLFEIVEAANKKFGKRIPVISDEPYMRLLYVERNESMLKLYPYTFLVRSLSKDLGLAGERIGYFAWRNDVFPSENETTDLLHVFRNAARVSGFVSAPRLMQRLIPYVFHARVDICVYQNRVEDFLKIFQEIGMHCIRPQAGFFVFPKVLDTYEDINFCEELAQKGVLCVPGVAFGKPAYMRASLTQNYDRNRVVKIFQSMKKNFKSYALSPFKPNIFLE